MITKRDTKKQSHSIPGALIETHEFEGEEESPYHSHHHYDEIYQIIQGTAIITKGGKVHRVTPIDPFIKIAPHTPHSIKNGEWGTLIFMSIKLGSHIDTEDFHLETPTPE